MGREEVALWLLLQRLCKGRAAALRRLQGIDPDPAKILDSNDRRWLACGVPGEIVSERATWRRQGVASPAWQAALREQDILHRMDAVLLAKGRVGYPPLLEEIPDPPPLLYVRGNPGVLAEAQIAVVGSRKASQAGRRAAIEFAAQLAESGLVISSGLALGIDGTAHRAALDAGGETVAVMATGVDRVYPRRHVNLARDICESGALVSEFPPGTAVRPEHFPRRNRVISGLSLGVLVIEAALPSGSLITARTALEQNREVFALPHSIYHPGGRGCNELLRQGAKLVESREDVLEELGSLFLARHRLAEDKQQTEPDLPEQISEIYRELGFEPVGIEELVECTDRGSQEILSALVELQLRGLVEQSQGLYMRCR